MGEEKFASLSSGLLARKGTAKPAMRRQGYINPHGDVADDLGWNDMGFEPPQPMDAGEDALAEGADDAPEPPPVRQQIEGLADRFDAEEAEWAEEEPEPSEISEVTPLPVVPRPRPATTAAKTKVLAREKAAFTLRLDPDRHLKLRLAAAVSKCSAQQLVTEALDAFLAGMPELDRLAARAPRRQSH